MFTLNYIHKVILTNVPFQWTTRIELFTPDLEQFPLMYVHMFIDHNEAASYGKHNHVGMQRIFGFILDFTYSDPDSDGLCELELSFICNLPQGLSKYFDSEIKKELSHRIGLADKICYEDLSEICINSPESLPLLQRIWKEKIENVYGKYIPHGRIFDEMLGIVRFSAAGNAPRLGKVSEFRMLYWYLKDLGEKIEFGEDLEHMSFIEFYIIPTYKELINENFIFFKTFDDYYQSTKEFWSQEYTNNISLGGHQFKYAPMDSLPVSGTGFENRYSSLLSSNDYDNMSKLRQIFNRMPSRLYGYVWNLMTPIENDYRQIFGLRDNFKNFYKKNTDIKGSSAKVVACFIQQAFGLEALPIDTWVKTFIYFPLGLKPKDKGFTDPNGKDLDILYDSYRHLDKLEKLIWVSSMGNKTNKSDFLDILWCQRYGTDKASKGPARGANPLSCSQCTLNNNCLSYQAIKDEEIYISDDKNALEFAMIENDCFFGVHTHNGTPRVVYTLEPGRKKGTKTFDERDSHTGLDIDISTTVSEGSIKLDDFVSMLEN